MESEVEFGNFSTIDDFSEFATAIDAGGTKTLYVLYGKTPNSEIEPICTVRILTRNSIIDDLRSYHEILIEQGLPVPKIGVIAAAGKVSDDARKCQLTNNELYVSADEIEDEFGLDVLIGNDFLVSGFGVNLFDHDNPKQVQPVIHLDGEIHEVEPTKTRAILGPGTGLGGAPIFHDNGVSYAKPAEFGHIASPASTELQYAITEYIRTNWNDGCTARLEDIASGIGLANLLFFAADGALPKSAKKLRKLQEDPEFQAFAEEQRTTEHGLVGRAVIDAYKTGEFNLKPLINIFRDYTAIAARNMWCTYLADGGIYIAGGNGRRLRKDLSSKSFVQTFEDHPAHGESLEKVPLYIVRDKMIAAHGAAWLAFNSAERYL